MPTLRVAKHELRVDADSLGTPREWFGLSMGWFTQGSKRKKDDAMKREEAEDFLYFLADRMAEIAVIVEAAGMREWARPLVARKFANHPDILPMLEELVPVKRGGPNDSEETELLWDETFQRKINTPEGRREFAQTQQQLV